MKLKWQYWFFKNALSHQFCDDIIRFCHKQKTELGTISGVPDKKKTEKDEKKTEKNLAKLLKHRNSNVGWIGEPWVYHEIHNLIHRANESAEWNFHWNYSEPAQYTIYRKGQFYEWHQDSFDKPTSNPNNKNFHNKIRKLSVTISLNDSSEYTGGRLQFLDRHGYKQKIITCKEILTKGSLVVFPSFMWHRVTPVTKGERKSLVMWNLGNPFI